MIQDIIKLLSDQRIRFETPIQVVEAGHSATGKPMTTTYADLCSLMIQFAGGLRPERILYIGDDKDKAKVIYDAYLTAHMKAKETRVQHVSN